MASEDLPSKDFSVTDYEYPPGVSRFRDGSTSADVFNGYVGSGFYLDLRDDISSSKPDLLDVSKTDFEIQPYKYKMFPEGTTVADYPKGFAVTEISIGGISRSILTETGRAVLRDVMCCLYDHINYCWPFDTLECKDIVYRKGDFNIEASKARRPDSDVKCMGKMVSAVQRFVESICGVSGSIPADLNHLLQVMTTNVTNKELLMNNLEIVLQHPCLVDPLRFGWNMWHMASVLGITKLPEMDLEVEVFLNNLDRHCYPASWIKCVKMFSACDTEYEFLEKVLKRCERKTHELLGSEKGGKVFNGVHGLVIFLRGLMLDVLKMGKSLRTETGAYPRLYVTRLKLRQDFREHMYRVYKAVNIMFPVFLPTVRTAALRSSALKDRVRCGSFP